MSVIPGRAEDKSGRNSRVRENICTGIYLKVQIETVKNMLCEQIMDNFACPDRESQMHFAWLAEFKHVLKSENFSWVLGLWSPLTKSWYISCKIWETVRFPKTRGICQRAQQNNQNPLNFTFSTTYVLVFPSLRISLRTCSQIFHATQIRVLDWVLDTFVLDTCRVLDICGELDTCGVLDT